MDKKNRGEVTGIRRYFTTRLVSSAASASLGQTESGAETRIYND